MSGGAAYTRLKVWATTEDITPTDLNAEFNQVLANSDPGGLGDDSVNVAEMQQQVTPGAQDTESLATNLAGELRRLRYVIARLTGETYWYDAPDLTLAEANTLLEQATALPDNRLVSGRVRTTSDQPLALVPHGTNPTASIQAGGADPSFVYRVAGTAYTLAADVTTATLALAPSTNNTVTVNDATLAGAESTKFVGERGTTLTVDAMGSEITALTGKYIGYQVGTEYGIAFVQSSTALTKMRRGYFFDSADATIPRVALTDNDVITLKRLTWLFVTVAGTLVPTYNNPTWAFDQPGSPSSGDYWFDFATMIWKTFNGSTFVDSTATLVGVCLQDTSGTKAARTFEYYKAFSDTNTVQLEYVDANTVRASHQGQQVSVWGTLHRFEAGYPTWSMISDLATGATDANSTTYYLYLTEDGDEVIDIIRPYDRSMDLLGEYHPHHSWRCLGEIPNDGAAAFVSASLRMYGQMRGEQLRDETVTNVKLVDRTVSAGKRAYPGESTTAAQDGVAIGATTATEDAGSSYASIGDGAVTITTSGRPVLLNIVNRDSTTSVQSITGGFRVSRESTGASSVMQAQGWIAIYRDGSFVTDWAAGFSFNQIGVAYADDDVLTITFPTSFTYIDRVAAGTYTYQIYMRYINDAEEEHAILYPASLQAVEL